LVVHQSISEIPAGIHSPAVAEQVGFPRMKRRLSIVVLANKRADYSSAAQTVPAEHVRVRMSALPADGCVSLPDVSAFETEIPPKRDL